MVTESSVLRISICTEKPDITNLQNVSCHLLILTLNTTKNFISISADGVSSKEQVIKSTVYDCNIKSYVLSKMEFALLSEESVLLTYTVDQEGTCGGAELNSKIRVAANYIKQNDKWLEAFYMESKID